MGPDGPKWGLEDFFPTNLNLADILGRTDLNFEKFYFFDFFDPKFPDASAAAADGRTLRSQPDPSPNAPRDQIRRKDPCCDKKYKFSKLKSMSPKMSVRSGLVGKKLLAPLGAISGQCFHGPEKKRYVLHVFAYVPRWSNRVLFTRFGVRCWCHA